MRVSLSEADQIQTLVVASGPARDFYLAASPNYEEISQTIGEVTVHSYAPRDSADGAQMALDVASRAIEDFSAHYAPYPYTEFDIVATSTPALGMEYPGIVAIASRIYDVDDNFGGTPANLLESVVAHEVGHQWFYNLVGDDQLDDPWLDEALTQFATLQYYADEYGPGGAEWFSRFARRLAGQRVGNADIPIGLPVAEYDRAAIWRDRVWARSTYFSLR